MWWLSEDRRINGVRSVRDFEKKNETRKKLYAVTALKVTVSKMKTKRCNDDTPQTATGAWPLSAKRQPNAIESD
ncbi:hypothetical protein GWI33_006320 [Rhynchophorus ferrugineus]|uniref:Uncharacterized protein n=1 Tax=Rhynchophorus ferrugineus TaxID=354439 RepID=A0A834IGA7_RHYFE|nr:hypothetical protein GWI33_006320 [Rhynchophorus ferrugineus]